jgi:hypothetical protein
LVIEGGGAVKLYRIRRTLENGVHEYWQDWSKHVTWGPRKTARVTEIRDLAARLKRLANSGESMRALGLRAVIVTSRVKP